MTARPATPAQRCAVVKDENGSVICVWLGENFDLRKMDPTWRVTFPTIERAARELLGEGNGS